MPETDAMSRVREDMDHISELSETELAYIAGFVDADGSITIVPTNSRTYTVEINIYNSDGETIAWLAHKLQGADPTQDSFDHRSERWRTEQSLRIRREKNARAFLEVIQPYLVTKADVAENALQLLNLKLERDSFHMTDEMITQQEEIYERHRRINGNGPT